MTKKNVAVIGANGRMGQEISRLLQASSDLRASLGIVRNGQAAGFERSAHGLKKKDFKDIDVVIDFSSLENFDDNLHFFSEEKIPLVSGVTGLSQKQFSNIEKSSKHSAVLWAPNMSLGVAVLAKALSAIQGVKGFDFQIEEFHHNKKKDNPSGTALFLQKELEKIVGKKCSPPIGIRGGGIVGVHRVHMMAENETLSFEHVATNRKLFADGAVVAAKFMIKKKSGFFEMKDILEF
ncbi:MAG: 4-hydroxy-tetrahydrodipicolinate reductase [Bdellovibrio sp. CG10_big_fil_rev_8_21_14_0_10_47_8]|nr:MAG: 4-hydroxy-tetrahydrodipicolinate reductase [Bdellovibrio sp. CG10_big_fil_rev_8_21_14_0_10_47_8]